MISTTPNATPVFAEIASGAPLFGVAPIRNSKPSKTTMYCVTDRLHDGRAVQVPGHQIAPIVSAWLAELGADSPLVQDLAQAARVGDWASACAVGNQLR